MSNLVALAEKIEAAMGPSRELDAEIENLLAGGSAKDLAYILTDIERITRPEHYTASIDAALTLVPDGSGNGSFFLQRNRFGSSHATVWYNTEFNFYRDGDGATPALALCAAILRARAAAQPTEETHNGQ